MKTEIYTAYAQRNDMTFIMQDVYNEADKLISTECVGWYWGAPSEAETAEFIGKLKAEY